MSKNKWMPAFGGLIIGATMIVPGVSGGSMAMVLGIYDRLITAVSSFRKNPKENFLFLLKFVISAGLGMILFSTPLSWLLENYSDYTRCFFLGAVFGGIPMIGRKAQVEKIRWIELFYMILGVICVLLFANIPEGIFQADSAVTLILAGILSAAALVLPGISVSHFFLVLGIYETFLMALKEFELSILIPLGSGIIIGIIVSTKAIEYILKKFARAAYLTILGFVLGSALEIFPGMLRGVSWLICGVTFIFGFMVIYYLSGTKY